ncbi:hypothetical protein DUI87_11590 [Hirundo rustica rustica]|uniref:Armadillo-like helical domain-containing protein n=1 Tax=Hirundo rustica rustica TaxID=333673 RepID=A0A3M0KFU8_HIRRU|nr:hypothetical protein DUI87_11590 [Hirundo rustica rustica]
MSKLRPRSNPVAVYSMAQTEKKGGLLRKSSASKKPLKEKVVLMYDEIFTTEDPSKCNPRFWEELFLMKVNLEYLEGKLEALDGEELMKIKDNINCLFQHCIQALGEEHPIRVVNALQTLCALIRGVHQKNKSTSGFDIINMLVGFDKAELCMKNLMESLDSLLCAEGSESLKSLCLKLLLCLVTVTDNISQNTILEYVMINSIFEAILQILSSPLSRREHGYDAVVLLALLVNYRKYEAELKTIFLSSFSPHPEQSVNPYIVKLSIVDDEATLNGMGLVIAQALSEYNRQYKDKEEEHQTGFFSALTNMVGSMFIADADEKISVQTNEAILLALYEAVHLNRNFITVLAQSHPEMGLLTAPTSPVPTTPVTPLGTTPPSSDVISSAELPLDADVQTSNLLITFLKYSSIVMQDTKDEHRLHSGKLCLIILTCIAEDQYANAFLHDDNMNFRVNLHRMPMRHRKKAADKNLPCRPLVCAVLDLMVEFIVTHMMKEFPMDLYVRCIQIVHKLLCYQKKCRVRLHYTWRELWSDILANWKSPGVLCQGIPYNISSGDIPISDLGCVRILAMLMVRRSNRDRNRVYQGRRQIGGAPPRQNQKSYLAALINLLKFLMSNETVLLAKHNIFTLALMVVNLFNMFITYGDTFLPTPSSYDELYYEIIRMHQNFDNLYSMGHVKVDLLVEKCIFICGVGGDLQSAETVQINVFVGTSIAARKQPDSFGPKNWLYWNMIEAQFETAVYSLSKLCPCWFYSLGREKAFKSILEKDKLVWGQVQTSIRNHGFLLKDSGLMLSPAQPREIPTYRVSLSVGVPDDFEGAKTPFGTKGPVHQLQGLNPGTWKRPLAIINHFNPKIESYAAVNHISQLSEDQVLEVVRSNYDTLTLKLQDGLDQYERYSEQHKEAAFFKELAVMFPRAENSPRLVPSSGSLALEHLVGLGPNPVSGTPVSWQQGSPVPTRVQRPLAVVFNTGYNCAHLARCGPKLFEDGVRSISINVRKNLAFNTLSQELLLKEFSTIS